MTYANDGLRFFLELSMLAALAYWGFAAVVLDPEVVSDRKQLLAHGFTSI